MANASRFFRLNYGLKILTDNSYRAINEGAYDVKPEYHLTHEPISIKKSILKCPHVPLITEIKLSSPSRGRLSASINEKTMITAAQGMVESGAAALSVLTQPYLFSGSIKHLARIRKQVEVPVLMKDIMVSEVQIDSAKKIGADCILLIKSIFDLDLAEGSIERFSNLARSKGLSTLVEVHYENEYKEVLDNTENYDLIGINNRNLSTLKTDLEVSMRLLKKYDKAKNVIVSESGIASSEQILSLKNAGADAFLVGTSIIQSEDISTKVMQLCRSY
jgi:indole-3-glycerol phosphate synthase